MIKWMSTKQAAEYLGLSPAVIRRHAQECLIRSYRPGGKKLMFDKDDLDAFVKGGGNEPESCAVVPDTSHTKS